MDENKTTMELPLGAEGDVPTAEKEQQITAEKEQQTAEPQTESQTVDEETAESQTQLQTVEEETDKQYYDDDLYDDDADEKFDDNQRPNEPVVYEHSYRIPVDTYAAFDEYIGQARIQKDRKSKATMGSLEVAFSIFYVYMIAKDNIDLNAMNIMVVLMFFGLGTYNMLYYKYFYENRKKLAVQRYYDRNPYFQSDITLTIYETCFVERAADVDTVYRWRRIKGVREFADCFHLIVAERRIILVPKPEDKEEALKMREALLDGCDRFEKEWLTP